MKPGHAHATMLTASLLLLAAPGSPQDPAGSPRAKEPPLSRQAAPPVFGTDVSLVLLPVFVSDTGGRAVRGLRAEDFAVQDDGGAAQVVLFRYVDTTDPEQPLEQLGVASAARRRFLLLFDKSFTDPGGLHRAQKAAADFVRMRLAETDLAAVATFDVQRGIRLVANFTEDRSLLVHAVATLGIPQLSRISDPLGLAADAAVTDIAAPAGSADQPIPQALLENVLSVLVRQMRSAEQQQYESHIATFGDSLQDLARGLRNVEGRKQVLLFSAGFDSRLLVGEEGDARVSSSLSLEQGRLWEVDGQARYGDSRLRQMLSDALRQLTAADAVIHSVDVTGLGAGLTLDQIPEPMLTGRRNPGREVLNLLAADSGGRLFADTTDLTGALGEMLEMTSRYYVLGIQPRDPRGPGQFHKLKVRVARKGVDLSHRPGYYERTPVPQQTVLQRQFEAAQLVMTGAGDADLPFASLCLPFPEKGDRQTLGVVVQVPRESLRWTAGTSESLELYGYAVAEDGSVKDHLAQLARVDPGQADPGGLRLGVSFFGTLRVPPGTYSLRLMLHERESGRSGMQFLEVTVPPYDPQVGFLLPPVVMDDPERWVTLELGRRGDARPFPFEIDGQPFLPRASSAVSSGARERMVLIAYEPRLKGDPAADLQIWTSLVDHEGGRSAPGALRVEQVHDDGAGRRTYVLGLIPEVARAGDYTLRVSVGEAGALLESYARLRVGPGGP
jgi:VWFA-related protein